MEMRYIALISALKIELTLFTCIKFLRKLVEILETYFEATVLNHYI